MDANPSGTDHVRNTTLALIFFVVRIAVTVFGFFYALAYGVFLFTGLLAAVPAALYGISFYLARERIVRHAIPPPMTQ